MMADKKNKLVNNSAIYSRKALWKRVLIVAALIIVGVSFFYSSRLVNQLSQEERIKVRLWADAIENKAFTVNKTARLFKDLAEVERQKIELWAKAMETLISPTELRPNDNKLAVDIIGANQTIPLILTSQEGKVTGSRNVEGIIDTLSLQGEERKEAVRRNSVLLDSLLEEWKIIGDRIDVNFLEDQHIYLYYKDSRILEELRKTFDNIQNSFVSDVISMAASTPVIYLRGDSVIASNNIDSVILVDSMLLNRKLQLMQSENEPIVVDLGYDELNYIYYSNSDLLNTLKYYSAVQIAVMFLFVLIGYWLFSIFRRSEQNNVWVGMAKETAHQLGTPLSSLLGWMEVLRMKNVDSEIISEMEKDVNRLNMITDRFSKIGAKPNLENQDVMESLEKFVTYFRTRAPRKVKIELRQNSSENIICPINEPLFHWVIENLCKNGIDAMEGKGKILIELSEENNHVVIDVTDTGKGIPGTKWNEVFQPGFTSKERGWGLGLSLTKRIVREYHNGKIFVKWSEPDHGTTFRIILNR
jgi:hypothetical protein